MYHNLVGRTPFGEIIGDKPDIPFTFSTKAVDASGLAYYGYRFYNPKLGKWMSRDPIEEEGGWNLYAMVKNSPTIYIDGLGLMTGTVSPFTTPPYDSEGYLLAIISKDNPFYAKITPNLDENKCLCKCPKPGNTWYMSCSLSVLYRIIFPTDASNIWNEGKPPASFPLYPVPRNWADLSLEKRKEFIKGHEQLHVTHYRTWLSERKTIIEKAENEGYKIELECTAAAKLVEGANKTSFDNKKADEENHIGWDKSK